MKRLLIISAVVALMPAASEANRRPFEPARSWAEASWAEVSKPLPELPAALMPTGRDLKAEFAALQAMMARTEVDRAPAKPATAEVPVESPFLEWLRRESERRRNSATPEGAR